MTVRLHMHEWRPHRQDVADLVRAREILLADIVAAISNDEPSFTYFESAADERDCVVTVAWLLELFLETASDGRWLTSQEARTIRGVGTAASQLVGEAVVLRTAVRSAAGALRAHIVGEHPVEAPGDRAALESLLGLLHRFASAVEDLLHEGFAAGSDTCSASDPVAVLIGDAVELRVRNAEELESRAQEIGCDTGATRALMLTQSPRLAEKLASAVPGARLVHRPGVPSRAYSVVVAVVVPDEWHEVLDHCRQAALATAGTLLVCGPSACLGELYDRYLLATALVPYLGRIAAGEPLMFDGDVELAALVAAVPRDMRRAFVRLMLERPLENGGPDARLRLLDHLGHNVRLGFAVAAVQRATGVNRKTAYAWQEKARRVLGRSLTEPRDQALLALAHYGLSLETDG